MGFFGQFAGRRAETSRSGKSRDEFLLPWSLMTADNLTLVGGLSRVYVLPFCVFRWRQVRAESRCIRSQVITSRPAVRDRERKNEKTREKQTNGAGPNSWVFWGLGFVTNNLRYDMFISVYLEMSPVKDLFRNIAGLRPCKDPIVIALFTLLFIIHRQLQVPF